MPAPLAPSGFVSAISKITQVEYSVSPRAQDEGVLSPLIPRLSQTLACDHLSLERIPPFTLAALTFRRGAKRFFHLRLIRQSGRYLVELSGLQSAQVLEAMRVCRDHFDHWFGITGREIKAYESHLNRTQPRKNPPA